MKAQINITQINHTGNAFFASYPNNFFIARALIHVSVQFHAINSLTNHEYKWFNLLNENMSASEKGKREI
jgi:hypothetical protein